VAVKGKGAVVGGNAPRRCKDFLDLDCLDCSRTHAHGHDDVVNVIVGGATHRPAALLH